MFLKDITFNSFKEKAILIMRTPQGKHYVGEDFNRLYKGGKE